MGLGLGQIAFVPALSSSGAWIVSSYDVGTTEILRRIRVRPGAVWSIGELELLKQFDVGQDDAEQIANTKHQWNGELTLSLTVPKDPRVRWPVELEDRSEAWLTLKRPEWWVDASDSRR
jgi:hypothetical protein